MKKFKKLIPAICMLLVSAIILGGSTFAWFSMNDKVTATGMSVTAKTNTKFLVISASDTLGTLTGLNTNATGADKLEVLNGYGMTVGSSKNYVYPVAYTTADNTKVNVLNADGKTVTETTVNKKTWYTAHSPKYNSVTGGTIAEKDNVVTNFLLLDETINPAQPGLTENQQKTNLGKYALKYLVYIGLAKDSETVTGTMTVTATIKAKAGEATLADKAIKVLVVFHGIDADGQEIEGDKQPRLLLSNENTTATDDSNTTKGTTPSATPFTLKATKTNDTTATQQLVKAEIYIFIDGNSASVKDLDTNNELTALSGVVDLTFHMSGIAG